MCPLELSPFDHKVVAEISNAAAPGKHAARSAVRHLERAWAIAQIDAEMAVFHGITAEEEAAAAIFHSLRRHQYPGANRIRWRLHEYKSAVIPFFAAVWHLLARTKGLEAGLQFVEEDGRTVLKTWTKVVAPDGVEYRGYPDPPLHYEISVRGKRHTFADEITKVANERNVESIRTHVKQRANLRNQILYASPLGLPNFTGDIETHLRGRQKNVMRLLKAFLLIDPYPSHQLFVVQALDAFIAMMDAVLRGAGRHST